MLLTSSQVSFAISAGIIVIFAFALFLSGYVIQQRTLRDLREAIRPKPSPKIFLPDRFKQSTTELPDGTIITLDDDDANANRDPVVTVEVKQTLPEDLKIPTQQQQDQKPIARSEAEAEEEGTTPQQASKTTTSKRQPPKDKKKKNNKNKNNVVDEPPKPISRAERRRRIKEDIQKLSQGQEKGYYQRRLY
ncbi:hypothetical protein B0H63DRAFT_285572 [Podospora didyma]|uniref:Uncharacterized protein n=1 Tax=Podospora didyma TaxID=330526 RepID=A0AAE0K8A9_9PEZI|nr:hypothetical protein B0H63DRAFT_285572 [Podospora didyma]